MALTVRGTKLARAAGHVSHDAQVRIDERVARILARQDSDRRAGRTAALRPKESEHVETRRER
jgi:hypothetical protein